MAIDLRAGLRQSLKTSLKTGLVGATGGGFDADATAYIAAVEAADGAALEAGVKTAINDFVVGCKADGIWTALKASCILAGARTLSGALVPLAGTAPTNNNFVSGDYNRKTGLVGDASTKYLNSNRNSNTDPQDNRHVAVYSSVSSTNVSYYLGAGQIQNGSTVITRIPAGNSLMRLASNSTVGGTTLVNGLNAISRADNSNILVRNNGTTISYSNASATPVSANFFVFGANDGGLVASTDARLAFYSIGESLDLALLDARVTTLIAAYDAAIP